MARDSRNKKQEKKKGGLGRGLGALFEEEPQVKPAEEIEDLPLAEVRPNPYQPRKNFDEKKLAIVASTGSFNPSPSAGSRRATTRSSPVSAAAGLPN